MCPECRVAVNAAAGIFVAAVAWLAAAAPAQAQADAADSQIQIAYLYPDTPALKPVEALLKEFRILERTRGSLSNIKLPGPLLLRFAECKEENAWYDPGTHTVTFCYELVAHVQKITPRQPQAGIYPQEVVIGSVVFSLLHEIGHAFFDMLEMPVLGREEDAADQLAAYILLQLDKPLPLKLVGGAAWMWSYEAKRETIDQGDFADAHSLSAQRFFNLMCIAYGSDPATFSFLTEQRYLPAARAERCGYEYKRVAFAVRKLLWSHSDQALMEAMRDEQRRNLPENAEMGGRR